MKSLFVKLSLLGSIFFFSACNGPDPINMEIPNLSGPKVTLSNSEVLIEMTFEKVEITEPLFIMIPEYQNSYVSISPTADSGMKMVATISIVDILDDELQLLPPQRLPDGRNLPGVEGGFLPSVAFQVPELGDTTFYLGEKFFGFFVPFDHGIDNDSIITARFYSKGARLGNLSIVGAVTEEDRGALLLLDLSKSIKARLRKLL